MAAGLIFLASWLAAWPAAARPILGMVPAPSRPASFEHQMTRLRSAAIPETVDFIGRIDDSSLPQAQLSALQSAAMRVPSFSPEGQLQVIEALKRAAASPSNAAVVRGAAIDALGRSAPRFRSPEAMRQAVAALTEAAHAEAGSRLAPFRLDALLGLSELSDHMPWIDRRSDELMVLTALDGSRQASGAREDELAMMILYNLVQARGGGVVYHTPALGDRLDSGLIWPLEVGLSDYYSDVRHDRQSRYFLMGSLRWIAASRELPDPKISKRIERVLRHMAELDPEPSLKQLARLYSEELQAGTKP